MNLEDYKKLLDQNTFDAMGESDETKSRYTSFKRCLDFLSTIENPQVLEIGTSRSFVSGAFEGCNSDDPKYWNPNDFSKWDWGAGVFTLVFGQTKCELTTVDLMESHIKRCKTMTDSLKIKCNHVVSDSVQFLQNTNKKFDLIYLDSGDMWPIDPSAHLQLSEVKVIKERNLLTPNGLILIDDVRNKTPRDYGDTTNLLGKSKYSIPYLTSNNYKVIFEGYQYIVAKQ